MSRSRSTLEGSARIAAKLAGFAFLLSTAAPARAQTPVVFGDTISQPGVYFLAGNQSGPGTGIRIESDDVTLLLLRFTLRGEGSNAGVFSSSQDRVAIYGGRITNFKLGISLNVEEHCTVRDTRIDSCTLIGVALNFVNESSFVRLRSDHNVSYGVSLLNGYDNRFVSVLSDHNGGNGIDIQNTTPGVALGESNGNRVRFCRAAHNDLDGIRVLDSHDNDVSRNQCVDNGEAGIRLGVLSDETASNLVQGSDTRNNLLESNWCAFNGTGIVVEWNAIENTMTNNTSLANRRDMVDDNAPPPCANTWFLNSFLTKGGAGASCIF